MGENYRFMQNDLIFDSQKFAKIFSNLNGK